MMTINFEKDFGPMPKIYKDHADTATSMWKKNCPVYCKVKGFERINKHRVAITVIDKSDDTRKVWAAPRYLLSEMNRARLNVIDDATRNTSRWKKFWCRILKRPLLVGDPMDNKVFEIRREGEGIKTMYTVKVRDE